MGRKPVNGLFLAFSESNKISALCVTVMVNVGNDIKTFLSPWPVQPSRFQIVHNRFHFEWKQAPHPQERKTPAHFKKQTAALSFQKEN